MSKNRDRIIQSALTLFAQKDFETVTIKDICANAQVANSTFYYHFKTKEELMDCLRTHDMRPKRGDWLALAGTHDTVERILGVSSMCAVRAERSGWGLTTQYYKRKLSLEEEPSELQELYVQELHTAEELIRHAQADGLIQNAAPADELALAAKHLANSVVMSWCVAKGGFDLMQTVRRNLLILLEMK